jgi:hypothetical protein
MIKVIGRLDIKGSNCINGICLKGLRVIGLPNEFVLKFNREGIDACNFAYYFVSVGRDY